MVKFGKSILVALAISPLTILIGHWCNQVSMEKSSSTTFFIAIVFTIAYTISQVMAYTQFKDISVKDFLGSNHTISLPHDSRIIALIDSHATSVFSDVICTDKQDEHGYRLYDINDGGYGSFLKVEFGGPTIEVSIKSKWLFSFFRGKAKNYSILSRLKEEAEGLISA